ncbi:ricin-type beta-trefoil lectin protein [Streptomyces sp. Ag82_O1-15]|nr:ricin-type beta-trefoil lectin protein [Streptomyces sp. Ag82_O1-15]
MTYVLKAARRACAVAFALVSLLFLSTPSAQAATYQELRNARALKCLAFPNSSQANGTEAIQWTCNDDTDQRWELHEVGDNQVRIINQSSGKCLNSGSSDGNSTWQWTCNDTPSTEELWIHDRMDRLRSGLWRRGRVVSCLEAASLRNRARLARCDHLGWLVA